MPLPVAAALAIQVAAPILMDKLFGGASDAEKNAAKQMQLQTSALKEIARLDQLYGGAGSPARLHFGLKGQNIHEVLDSINIGAWGQRQRAASRAGQAPSGISQLLASESKADELEQQGFAQSGDFFTALINELLKKKATAPSPASSLAGSGGAGYEGPVLG